MCIIEMVFWFLINCLLVLYQVGPQAVYVVGRDDDESIVAGSDVSDDAASWETVEDDEMDALNNKEKVCVPFWISVWSVDDLPTFRSKG